MHIQKQDNLIRIVTLNISGRSTDFPLHSYFKTEDEVKSYIHAMKLIHPNVVFLREQDSL